MGHWTSKRVSLGNCQTGFEFWTICEVLVKSVKLFEPQFLQLQNGDHMPTQKMEG